MFEAGKNPATGTPAQIKKRLAENPDARYSKKYRDTVAIAHSSAMIPTEGETVYMTDFTNLSLGKETLTPGKHGIHQTRAVDYTLGNNNLASVGVFTVTDPGRLLDYMKEQFNVALADKNRAVRVYTGESSEYKSLTGMQYEVPGMHEQIAQRMLLHIEASGRQLPVGRGLPAAHAEVQAGSAALYVQQHLTGSTNPEEIVLATQRLQAVEHAEAFLACFSCVGHLVETYGSTVKPFGILTGSTDMNHEAWRNQLAQLPDQLPDQL